MSRAHWTENAERVDALQAKAEAATSGPWFVDPPDPEGHAFVGNRADGRKSGLWEIVHMSGDELRDLTPGAQARTLTNAEFIAAASPPVVLALIERVKAAERREADRSASLAEVARLYRHYLDRARAAESLTRGHFEADGWCAAERKAQDEHQRAEEAEAELAEVKEDVLALADEFTAYDCCVDAVPAEVEFRADYEYGVNECGRRLRAAVEQGKAGQA